MGRKSTKEDKSVYQIAREELGYTREKASDIMEAMSSDRLEKLENGRTKLTPYDVCEMAKAYNNPHLCNHFCTKDCEIGRLYVPEVKIKDLSQIVLEMLNSLSVMNIKKEKLIEISVDGEITNDEIEEFVRIQKEIDRLSVIVDTFRLWTEQMKNSGKIDMEIYRQYMGE